jgi:hypothetical protein
VEYNCFFWDLPKEDTEVDLNAIVSCRRPSSIVVKDGRVR